MITPDALRKKLQRAYRIFLESWITDTESIFPYQIPVGRIPKKDYHALREGVLALQSDAEKWGYELQQETKMLRTLGEKTYPTQIIIPNQEILLSILSKKSEFLAFQKNVDLLRKRLPQLDGWLLGNIKLIISYRAVWGDLIKVCEYFIAHPKPNCYIRELPVEVHTKFVESYKPILSILLNFLLPPNAIDNAEKEFEKRYSLRYNEPLVRIRILDETLRLNHSFPLSDMSVRLSDAVATPILAKNCLVIENQMTFLALPPLPDAIAIFGQGKRAATLRELSWLKQVNIFYWGDLDVDGFGILSSCNINHDG